MPKGEGQGAKILYILKILWEESDEEHPFTATMMLERLQQYGITAERKSIYSDIALLEEFGFDVVRTKQGAYIGSRYFEVPEWKLLVDAVQASRFITNKKSKELTDKLSDMMSRHEQKRFRPQVVIRNRVKNMNESIYYNVDAIHEAIAENRQITFTYWNWNENKKMVPRKHGNPYRISPWVLLWESERYYLVGYDESALCMKHFRVDKMDNIQMTDMEREGKKEIAQLEGSSYGAEHFGMFGGKTETVTLKVDKELAGAMIDHFGKDVWLTPFDDQYVHVTVDVVVSNPFLGWLTGFADKIRIEKPEWVREEYENLLGMILENYTEEKN